MATEKETITMEETTKLDETGLKAEIEKLEKRITNNEAHIDKLVARGRKLKIEQYVMKKKRVELLQQDLNGDDVAVSEGLKKEDGKDN